MENWKFFTINVIKLHIIALSDQKKKTHLSVRNTSNRKIAKDLTGNSQMTNKQ